MNIIQSYWSKPTLASQNSNAEYNRFCGGWLSEKHHAISWAYSLLSLKRQHPEKKISLYTDSEGYKWLIEKLQLDYDEVRIELDVMNGYSSVLWAMAKVYTYSLQREPFIHVDGDVFIWQRFNDELLSGKLIAQNLEIGHPIYNELLQEGKSKFSGIPDFIANIDSTKDLEAVNAGILGANDIEFVQDYCKLVLDFIKENESCIVASQSGGSFNMYLEQLFFAQMARVKYHEGIRAIKTLLNDNEGHLYNLTRFGIVPQAKNYIHMIGMSKSMPAFVSQMEQRFRFEFPKMYHHLQDIYQHKSIYHIVQNAYFSNEGPSAKPFEKEPLAACKTLVQNLNNTLDPIAVNHETIEALLEENYENPAYYKLWDLYQLESVELDMAKFAAYEESKNFQYLYSHNIDEFMDIPFELNMDVCEIVYLFNEWVFQEEREGDSIPFGQSSLCCVPTEKSILKPWMVAQTYNNLELIKLNGWFGIFTFMEDRVMSGNEILAILQNEKNIATNTSTLKNDLYDFLSGQFILYNRIMPASRNMFSIS